MEYGEMETEETDESINTAPSSCVMWASHLRGSNAHPNSSCGEDQSRESRHILHVNEPSLELLAIRAIRKG